jgi:SUR7/PalI family
MNLRTRAATPATVFLLAAFVLLLLSCISVPITKTIALGEFNGVTFGVFGYCIDGSTCSSVQLGYNPDAALFQAASTSSSSSSSRRRFKRDLPEHIVRLLARQGPPPGPPGGGNNNFSLPPSARNGLSNILIVHVIAAALTLLALILSIIAHIRSPSHSTRFLLAIFIILILTTLLTLLSFLVDLLVFVPHFAFGTWLVLAATICNAVATSTFPSGPIPYTCLTMLVLLCCGRRTLIARKAMRRRIAENAEMSGVNYYKEEAAKDFALRDSDPGRVPQYAEFEVTKPASPDRLPLNPSSQNLMPDHRSGETVSTESSLPGSYNAVVPTTSNPPRVGLPSGPSPYGGAGYPPAVRMPRPPYPGAVPPPSRGNDPYGAPPPGSRGNDRYGPPPPVPPPPGMIPGVLPPSRSNASLNSMNRPPQRQNYENPYNPPPPLPATVDRHASSVYSDYVPPRRQWGSIPAESRSLQDAPLQSHDRGYRPEVPKIDTFNLNDRNASGPYPQQRQVSPVDNSRRRSDTGGGSMIASYYEDVDPRYDDNPEEEIEASNAYRPVAPLTASARRRSDLVDQPDRYSPIERNYSYNSLGKEVEEGPRSPAASTSSHFTSVSQRGVNPRWQPPPQSGGPYGDGYARRNRTPRNDQMNFLSGNPDFELPAPRTKRNGSAGMNTGVDMGSRYPVPR